MKILINGKPVPDEPDADIVEVEPGVYSVLLHSRSYEARVNGTDVTIAGQRFHIEIADPRRWNPASSGLRAEGRKSIKAPMPGKIVRLLVAAGDTVEMGQGIVVIEAMKMQNELKAPQAGRVASVSVQENDAVTAGTVLAIIE